MRKLRANELAAIFLISLEDTPELMRHFYQGQLWRNIKQRFGEKFVLPVFMYSDDFNVTMY